VRGGVISDSRAGKGRRRAFFVERETLVYFFFPADIVLRGDPERCQAQLRTPFHFFLFFLLAPFLLRSWRSSPFFWLTGQLGQSYKRGIW
jgi:hypothetical protein